MSLSARRIEYKPIDTIGGLLDDERLYDFIDKFFSDNGKVGDSAVFYISKDQIEKAEKDTNLTQGEKEVLKILRREVEKHKDFDLSLGW